MDGKKYDGTDRVYSAPCLLKFGAVFIDLFGRGQICVPAGCGDIRQVTNLFNSLKNLALQPVRETVNPVKVQVRLTRRLATTIALIAT